MLGARIKAIRKTLGKNQDEFSTILGIKRSTVGNWETNISEPDIDTLLKIADLGKVTLDWLLTGIESEFKPPINDGTNLISNASTAPGYWYPVVGRVRAGSEMIFDRADVVSEMFIDYRKKNNCFCVMVEGESMLPRLAPGDIVLVDPEETPLSGDVVVILLSGRQMVKKLHIGKDDAIELHSFNPEYPIIFTEKEEIQAMYRVVLKQAKPEKM